LKHFKGVLGAEGIELSDFSTNLAKTNSAGMLKNIYKKRL